MPAAAPTPRPTVPAAVRALGLMDNAGTKLGTEMLDAQLASKTAGRPGGLSDVIARQLDRQIRRLAAMGRRVGREAVASQGGRIPARRAAGGF